MSEQAESLTLYEIDDSLLQLLAAREDITTMLLPVDEGGTQMGPEERKERLEELARVDDLLVEYRDREVAKVDRVRAFVLHARLLQQAHREEAERQRLLASVWEQREKLILNMVAAVIAKEPGRKLLEGRAGQFRLKKNGGKLPVVVNNPEILPEEAVKYTGAIGGATWQAILTACPWLEDELVRGPVAPSFKLKREPSLSALETLLEAQCEVCGGLGMVPGATAGAPNQNCPAGCRHGHATVPGAYLGERGSHVEVK